MRGHRAGTQKAPRKWSVLLDPGFLICPLHFLSCVPAKIIHPEFHRVLTLQCTENTKQPSYPVDKFKIIPITRFIIQIWTLVKNSRDLWPGMVVHTFNPSAQEAEEGVFLGVGAQHRLHSEFKAKPV